MRTTIHGSISWESLCRLAMGLTNGGAEESGQFHPDRVYMATHSIGGRRWDVREGAVPHVVPDGDWGQWRGWAEEDSHEFEWESGTSGAKLLATVGEGRWTLQYEGPPDRDEESNYLFHFLEEVEPKSLEVDEVKSLGFLREWIWEKRGSTFCDQKVATALARLEAVAV